MKKMFIGLLAIIISVTTVMAQTEKYGWMVGGNFNLTTGDNYTVIGFTPMAGMFVVDNLAVGGNVGLTYQKSGNTKQTDFGIGPFLRYYFLPGVNVRPFLHGDINYLSNKSTIGNLSSTNTGNRYFLGGGLAYFINNNVSLEGLAGYNHTKLTDFPGNGGFKFSVGFQVFLHGAQRGKGSRKS